MATYKAIVFTGGKHIKQDGTANIKIRIYHNGSAQYISTNHYINPELMGDDGTILPSYSDAELLNYDLGELIQQYRKVSLKLGSQRLSKMTSSELKEELLNNTGTDSEFIDFVMFANNIISKTVKRKTAEWYQNSLNSFISFIKNDRIDAKDITVRILEDYIRYLSEKKIIIEKKDKKTGRLISRMERYIEPGTISNYIRGLRTLYNKARKHFNNEDLDIIKIPYAPFNRIVIPQYRRKRKNLSVEDIIRIRDNEYCTGRANMARDMFMMMFYLMGININDLYKLGTEHMVYGRIIYERSKTDTSSNNDRFPLSIKIEPELQELLDRYSGGSLLSYIKVKYCCLNNFLRAVNIGLKQISKELNLGVPLSTNWARHSWASIARNKAGINKADIDFCLGHVNHDYKMADIYIDIDYSIYDKANRTVLDLLQKKEEKKG
ncbi:transposase [Bacteroides sp. AF16-49]|uniref:phage integrase SAM-like domain-containing protein n=1 Tax=Bacteroides sp. AF16-49 TaxID=2292192 RepID=UPI000EFFC67E|nr:phage integrase SAM-like domain-containing protein [Bacteroides sp. AF16-49]RHR75565.1 transposase [Bacteroides sp. AF16-49]